MSKWMARRRREAPRSSCHPPAEPAGSEGRGALGPGESYIVGRRSATPSEKEPPPPRGRLSTAGVDAGVRGERERLPPIPARLREEERNRGD